jgi:hypothetical protein
VSARLTHLVMAPNGRTTTPVTSVPKGLMQKLPLFMRSGPSPKTFPCYVVRSTQRIDPNPDLSIARDPTLGNQRLNNVTTHATKVKPQATQPTPSTPKEPHRANSGDRQGGMFDDLGTGTFPSGRRITRSAIPLPPPLPALRAQDTSTSPRIAQDSPGQSPASPLCAQHHSCSL